MTDDALVRLGQFLRRHRDAIGLTQLELGIASGTSEPTVRAIETGRRINPSPATLRAISAALHLSVDTAERVLAGEDVDDEPPAVDTGTKLSVEQRLDRIEQLLLQLLEEKEVEERAQGR